MIGFDRPDWFDAAACCSTPVAVMFPQRPRGAVRGYRRPDPAVAAKALCAVCPVQAECLDYAIANRIENGVWGGLDEWERKRARTLARLEARRSAA